MDATQVLMIQHKGVLTQLRINKVVVENRLDAVKCKTLFFYVINFRIANWRCQKG